MKIVLASNNQKKLKELVDIFNDAPYIIVPQSEFNISEANENGLSFVENALIKARHASQQANLPALADDSGLCVDALRGAPGIYSARFSGEHATDKRNNALLLEKIANIDDGNRGAYFYCALAFVSHAHDPTPLIISAKWHGQILHAEQGENGFGYDPLFYVPEYQCSSAQLDSAIKNSISHRAQAMQQLVPALQEYIAVSC